MPRPRDPLSSFALRITRGVTAGLALTLAPLSLAAPAAAITAPVTGVARAGSPSAVVRPRAEELRRAFDRHDAVELERLARRLGAPRLFALVERGTATREAALAALALVDDGLMVLPRLAALADQAETPAPLALALLDAARHIAERAARGEFDLDELPADLLRSAVDSLATFAAREEQPVGARLAAVDALAALAPLVTIVPVRLAALAATPDATVRRAIADALPLSSVPTLVKLLTEDGTSAVAAAAGAVLCRDLPLPGAEHKADRALRRAAELPVDARLRLRTLATDETLDEGVRLDLLPCLRAAAQRPEAQKADLEVLQALGRGPDGALKRRARAYGGR